MKKQAGYVKNGYDMPLLLSGIITTAFYCYHFWAAQRRNPADF